MVMSAKGQKRTYSLAMEPMALAMRLARSSRTYRSGRPPVGKKTISKSPLRYATSSQRSMDLFRSSDSRVCRIRTNYYRFHSGATNMRSANGAIILSTAKAKPRDAPRFLRIIVCGLRPQFEITA